MKVFNRRSVLWAGVAGAAGAAALRIRSGAIAAAPAVVLKAVVTIAGAKYEFRQDQGTDLGDFVSTIGALTQACVRIEVTGCQLTAFFRPDSTSERIEVVWNYRWIGHENTVECLLDSLKRLEYRGYEPAGIVALVDGSIVRRRAVGKIASLVARVAAGPARMPPNRFACRVSIPL